MDKRVIRGIYLYEFKLGTTAKEADEEIKAAFGQGCSTIRTAYRWYQKCRNGNESLEEHEGRGRHSDVDEDKLRDVVEEDPHKGTREIAKVLGVSHNTAVRHLKEIGKTKKLERLSMYRLLITGLKEVVQITERSDVDFLKGADMSKMKVLNDPERRLSVLVSSEGTVAAVGNEEEVRKIVPLRSKHWGI
ncbi:unnamed protein product [Heligmosomoides polygyrus]|uniref:HTH_48 domain-containing protein n=1 Tax=Heligmosomoides polygyrus TaxID=6339 RepID=A0A3P8FIE6_HELPZ|nr:unnamed protein product [Heligmosomoides polygyrus]